MSRKWMQFDTKGFKGNAIPTEVHNDVAKVLVRWMRKQGYTPASKDMEVYLEFAMFVKDKPMAGFNSPERKATNDITHSY